MKLLSLIAASKNPGDYRWEGLEQSYEDVLTAMRIFEESVRPSLWRRTLRKISGGQKLPKDDL